MKRTSILLALAVAAVPAVAGAQQDTTRRDTTQRDSIQRDTAQRAGQQRRTVESRGGEVEGPRRRVSRTARNSYGLDREQIRQLQQAINDRTQCDAGTVDGIIGPRTRRALACARRELNVQPAANIEELFGALQLEFEGMEGRQRAPGAVDPSGSQRRDTTGQQRDSTARPDTTMVRDTTIRRDSMPPRDTTVRRDSTSGQQGRGANPPR